VGVKFPVPVVDVGLFVGVVLFLRVLFFVPVVIMRLFVSFVLRVFFSKRQGVNEGCDLENGYAVCLNILDGIQDALLQAQAVNHHEIGARHEGDLR
jgi:hypothetical protein